MTTLRAALVDLLEDRALPLAEAADRHLAPEFEQRANGGSLSRSAFLDGVAELRRTSARIGITVLDEVVDGSRYAERHRIDVVGHDGGRLVREVFVFARLADDGRFLRIDEASVVEESTRPESTRPG